MAKADPDLSFVTSPLNTGMLAFMRSIQISEGVISALTGPEDDLIEVPVLISQKGIRGQTANYVPVADREKRVSDDRAAGAKAAASGKEKTESSAPGGSNIQTVDVCVTPEGTRRVAISFSLRVVPGSVRPHACDDAAVGREYEGLSALYEATGGYRRLAERYVWNLANGGFAWRNALVTDAPSVTITWGAGDRTIRLEDVSRLETSRPQPPARIADALGRPDLGEKLEELVDAFAEALSNRDGDMRIIKVRWEADAEPFQEIFPSQEYLNEGLARKQASSKVLARVINAKGEPQASIHSQKIGAAIRRIDDWHGRDDLGAIVVNPYSGVQETGEVVRLKRSFYEMCADPEALKVNADEFDFVMANLIRGGVFGASRKEAKKSPGRGAAKAAGEGGES